MTQEFLYYGELVSKEGLSPFPENLDTVWWVWDKQRMNQETKPTGGKNGAGYTEELKRSVVDHWCHSDKTAEQVAQEFASRSGMSEIGAGATVRRTSRWTRRCRRSPK